MIRPPKTIRKSLILAVKKPVFGRGKGKTRRAADRATPVMAQLFRDKKDKRDESNEPEDFKGRGRQIVPENPALIVGKGEGGGKLDQGSDDDDPGDGDQQHEQGVDDDAVPGRMLEARPEPGEGPGKLL